MRKWRSQYWYNSTASQFHEDMRQVLISDPVLKNLSCYQEVNVQDLVPAYPYHNHHFDWYIKELGLIVELHGEQHYKLTNRSNIGLDDAEVEFRRSKYRDSVKASAAMNEGFNYIAIPYKDRKKLSYELILKYIDAQENSNENPSN